MPKPLRILVIGTLPPPIGGGSISLKHLVDALAMRDDVRISVINTSGVRGHLLTGPFRLLLIVLRLLITAPRVDAVTLHLAATAIPLFGPFVVLACRLFRRPLILRKFGGTEHEQFGGTRRSLFEWVVRRADLYLLQTHKLMESAKNAGLDRIAWYPTSRPMLDYSDVPARTGNPCRRFVFVGHVKPAKGVALIVDAAGRLGDQISVDVFGPVMDGVSESLFTGSPNVTYRGVIPPGDTVDVMCKYDALLLPTYWEGEGYPGVLLEAFSAGLPVITTRWLSIPEIVDDTCGMLIEPKSADALYHALCALSGDQGLYDRLIEGVRAKRDAFDTKTWTQALVDHCLRLTGTADR